MALEDDILTLGRTPLLDELGRDALRLIAFSADRRTLASGEVLFREGDRAEGAYVVMSGMVMMSRAGGGGPTRRTVESGTLIGELALLSDATRPATATAVGPVEVCGIARDLFARLFEEYPDIARKLHARLAERIRANIQDLKAVEETLRKQPS